MSSTISYQALAEILKPGKRIAVVGASPKPARPSHWISEFLMNKGYEVVPVNPGHEELFGLKCYPDIASIPGTIDIVNIFRRSDSVMPIVMQAVERPEIKLLWMQDGVYNEAASDLATKHKLPIVMDDCIYRFLSRNG